MRTYLRASLALLLSATAAHAQETRYETIKLTASDGQTAAVFGLGVVIDGDTIAIGANGDNEAGAAAGAVYIFERGGVAWEETHKLTASDGVGGERFGLSTLALADDALFVGAPLDSHAGLYSGSVYVFQRDGNSWLELQKLTASDASAHDWFGRFVALDGDTLIVGAYGVSGPGAGGAYIFVRDGSAWVEQQKLIASDGAPHDGFGSSVSLVGDTAFVGAPGDDDSGSRSGSVYVFARNGSTWSEVQKLTASDAVAGDFFGGALAAADEMLVIGALNDSHPGGLALSGSAYVFTWTGTGWSEHEKLRPAGQGADDRFGASIWIDDDMLAIGSISEGGAGAAHVFRLDGGDWTEWLRLKSSDGAWRDGLGSPLALSGNTLVAGATGDDDAGGSSGAAYVFGLDDPPAAEAGPSQSAHVGATVSLDGSGSSDDLTASEDLIYSWSFASRPALSAATLTGADTSAPSFTLDVVGDYVVELVVTDAGGLASAPDTVTASSLNAPPNADAGFAQGTYLGDTVSLDGTGSSDPDFDGLSYSWALVTVPTGSGATLTGADTAGPTFDPDLVGTYVGELVVSDGYVDSAPDSVTVVVVSAEDYSQEQAAEALNEIAILPPASVTTTGNQTAMENWLEQAIDRIQSDKIDQAVSKLEQAIERTDGCALRGAPDTSGGGKDYVNNCSDQDVAYPLLVDAVEALETL